MSNKDTSYLQALCSISDDYLEYIDAMSCDEIHGEHTQMFGSGSQCRIKTIQNLFEKAIVDKKKSVASSIAYGNEEVNINNDIVKKVKDKYGSLKTFFENKFLLDSSMPSGLTLQYRNRTNVTDEDIKLLIEALYINGDLKIEDDKN